MNTPVSCSRRLKTYAQQIREDDELIDEQRRARNRLAAAIAILVLAVVAGYFWRMV